MSGRLASPYLLFLGGAVDPRFLKTAHGLRDWAPELCVGEWALAGATNSLGLPRLDPAQARAAGARSVLIGVAAIGGQIPLEWVGPLVSALDAGLDVVSGMHARLRDVQALREAAERTGRALVEVREPPRGIPVATGRRRTGRRLLTVGTDCALGKKYTALALTRAFRARGVDADFREATDAVLNITTGGGIGMSLEERMAPAERIRAELASLNMGSMNFGAWEMAEKRTEWMHDWEGPYLASTWNGIYPNTFAMIDTIITGLGDRHGTRFEFECYDVGHLYNLAYFVEKRRVTPPMMVQMIVGARGGIGADIENLHHMVRMADKLFGDDYAMSCLAVGRTQTSFLAQSAILGGNVRVGLEDSLYIAPRTLARSNAEQVAKIRRVLEELGREIATPAEARQMLALKGGDTVLC